MKANPKLLGAPLPPAEMFFRCQNGNGTKYNVPATSPSADKMVATFYDDFLEMMAYYSKVAEVFKKEFLTRFNR